MIFFQTDLGTVAVMEEILWKRIEAGRKEKKMRE